MSTYTIREIPGFNNYYIDSNAEVISHRGSQPTILRHIETNNVSFQGRNFNLTKLHRALFGVLYVGMYVEKEEKKHGN